MPKQFKRLKTYIYYFIEHQLHIRVRTLNYTSLLHKLSLSLNKAQNIGGLS